MAQAIRAVIVEDEAPLRRYLCVLLESLGGVEVVAECGEGKQAVRMIREVRSDIVFLDVVLPGLTGPEVLAALGPARSAEIVFVTGDIGTGARLFEEHGVEYLQKPYGAEELRNVVRLARQRIAVRQEEKKAAGVLRSGAEEAASRKEAGKREPLRVVTEDGIVFVTEEEVGLLETAGRHVIVHTRKETLRWRAALGEVVATLDADVFVQVHCRYVVNRGWIRKAIPLGRGEYFLELSNGRRIGTTRTYREAVESLVRSPRGAAGRRKETE